MKELTFQEQTLEALEGALWRLNFKESQGERLNEKERFERVTLMNAIRRMHRLLKHEEVFKS